MQSVCSLTLTSFDCIDIACIDTADFENLVAQSGLITIACVVERILTINSLTSEGKRACWCKNFTCVR